MQLDWIYLNENFIFKHNYAVLLGQRKSDSHVEDVAMVFNLIKVSGLPRFCTQFFFAIHTINCDMSVG